MRILTLSVLLLLTTATAQVTSGAPSPTPTAPTAAPRTPAQGSAVTKVEIQDVEVTAPASTAATPTVASDDVGEVLVPVLASDKDGTPAAGVEISWEVKNTGGSPVYVISSVTGGQVTQIAATIAPGASAVFKTVTGSDGSCGLMLNATANTSATLNLKTAFGEVKNLRAVTQTVDWIAQ